jgi:Zn-dependent M28 family amino/carboxypeptidase
MRRITVVLGLVLALLVAFGVVGVAPAAVPTDTTALRNAVTVESIMDHENAFQNIADANGGTRVSGTSGYDASAAYVVDKLEAAGYTVTEQKFTYPFFQELTPTTFSRTDGTVKSYVDGTGEGTDLNPPGYFHIMSYSGSADVVDAPVVPTNDIQIPPGSTANSSNSGCEASDFVPASETEDQVALIQRGGGTPGCNFQTKALNAQDAGYDAAIIFNEGQPGRTEVIPGTLSGLHPDGEQWIPVLMTSFAVGEELYDAYNEASPDARVPRVSISTDTLVQPRETSNIIADYPGGRTDRTVIVGAHLDSVPEGPGINDNGSGTAGLLEIALQMKKLNIKPTNHVRFAFWGAEESGPPQWGSQYYVDQLGQLDQPQRKDIALYLNFDMIGSPNYVRFVYDGDGNAVGPPGPNGSGTIEKVFRDYFASQNLATEPTPFDGRSDYLAFLQAGIPAGGLISGADGIKTPQQAAIYGGTAGEPYDSCYHQACDTIDNLNEESIEELADGAAHATLTFAQTTSAVKGTDKGSKTNTAASTMEYEGPMAIK